jgi:kinesin family protein C1
LLQQDTKKKYDYTIHHLEDGTTKVDYMESIPVSSAKEVFDLLGESIKIRSTASTMKNDLSSRSHYVFTLRIHGNRNGVPVEGVLNLIDLAGSERYDKETTNDRQSETKFINGSLAAVGDVIHALASGEKHVPYRNSKLTYLLQNCLSGKRSKTLMFVNVTSSTDSISETLSSLRFASKVNTCKIK